MITRREVLVRVHAVSVNPIDTYVRGGIVAMDLPMPYIIGCDAAGVVEAIGDQVESIDVGDRVWMTNQGLLGRQGTFAEKIAVEDQWCFPLPDDVSFETGAATALVGVTAHLGLFREADLQSDETVLVIGGTGGVGAMVVQMAKAIEARVITTCGSAKKCKRAAKLGADVVIDYTRESISDVVRRDAPDGIDVFWETRREPDFDAAVDMLAHRGRMVLMAGRDARPTFPVGPVLRQRMFIARFCDVQSLAPTRCEKPRTKSTSGFNVVSCKRTLPRHSRWMKRHSRTDCRKPARSENPVQSAEKSSCEFRRSAPNLIRGATAARHGQPRQSLLRFRAKPSRLLKSRMRS